MEGWSAMERVSPQGAPLTMYVKVEPLEPEAEYEEGLEAGAAADLSELLPDASDDPPPVDERDATPHPDAPLARCLHCHEDLPPGELQRHMVAAHLYRTVRYRCQVCEQLFRTRDLLNRHRSKRHEKPQLTCEICFVQVQKKYLAKHIQKVHCTPSALEKCPICEKIFKSKETLKDHIKTVHSTDDRPVHCRLCNQEFKSKKYLVNHTRNVHPPGDRTHACSKCRKIFKSKMCLHQHTKNVHPPESASAQCGECSKVFKTKANLAQHMKHVHPEVEKVKRKSIKSVTSFSEYIKSENLTLDNSSEALDVVSDSLDFLNASSFSEPLALNRSSLLSHGESLVHQAYAPNSSCNVALMDAGVP